MEVVYTGRQRNGYIDTLMQLPASAATPTVALPVPPNIRPSERILAARPRARPHSAQSSSLRQQIRRAPDVQGTSDRVEERLEEFRALKEKIKTLRESFIDVGQGLSIAAADASSAGRQAAVVQHSTRNLQEEVAAYYERSEARHRFLEAVRGRQAGVRAVIGAAANVAASVRSEVQRRFDNAIATAAVAEDLAGGAAELAALTGPRTTPAPVPAASRAATGHAHTASAATAAAAAAAAVDASEERMFARLMRVGVLPESQHTASSRGASGRALQQPASASPATLGDAIQEAARNDRAALLLATLSNGEPTSTITAATRAREGSAAGGLGTSRVGSVTSGSRVTAAYFAALDRLRTQSRPAGRTEEAGSPAGVGGGYHALGALGPHASGATTVQLSDAERDRLADVALRRWTTVCSNKAAEPCCICLDVMALQEPVRMLGCGHRMHGPCLLEYFKGKTTCVCPLCRAPMD